MRNKLNQQVMKTLFVFCFDQRCWIFSIYGHNRKNYWLQYHYKSPSPRGNFSKEPCGHNWCEYVTPITRNIRWKTPCSVRQEKKNEHNAGSTTKRNDRNSERDSKYLAISPHPIVSTNTYEEYADSFVLLAAYLQEHFHQGSYFCFFLRRFSVEFLFILFYFMHWFSVQFKICCCCCLISVYLSVWHILVYVLNSISTTVINQHSRYCIKAIYNISVFNSFLVFRIRLHDFFGMNIPLRNNLIFLFFVVHCFACLRDIYLACHLCVLCDISAQLFSNHTRFHPSFHANAIQVYFVSFLLFFHMLLLLLWGVVVVLKCVSCCVIVAIVMSIESIVVAYNFRFISFLWMVRVRWK